MNYIRIHKERFINALNIFYFNIIITLAISGVLWQIRFISKHSICEGIILKMKNFVKSPFFKAKNFLWRFNTFVFLLKYYHQDKPLEMLLFSKSTFTRYYFQIFFFFSSLQNCSTVAKISGKITSWTTYC